MVVAVGMAIEKVVSTRTVECGETILIASLTDVGHALEHDPTLPVAVVA